MPGTELPLNIFEPRYLNMISDAMGTHHMIGMIQPESGSVDTPALCHSGCAGRITHYHETPDGRIEIILHGVCRYDLGREIPTTRGYRMIVPDWSRFARDYPEADNSLEDEHSGLILSLKNYFRDKRVEADWSALDRLPTVRLMDSVAMALPLDWNDKQRLLECVAPDRRLQLLRQILGSDPGKSGASTLH